MEENIIFLRFPKKNFITKNNVIILRNKKETLFY